MCDVTLHTSLPKYLIMMWLPLTNIQCTYVHVYYVDVTQTHKLYIIYMCTCITHIHFVR